MNNELKIYNMGELGNSISETLLELKQLSNPTPQTIEEKSMAVISNIPLLGSFARNKLQKIKKHQLENTNATELAQQIFSKLEVQEQEVLEKSKNIEILKTKIEEENDLKLKRLNKIGNPKDNDVISLKEKQDLLISLSHNKDSLLRIEEIRESLLILNDVIENKIPNIKNRVIQNLQIHDGITTISNTLDGYKALESLCNDIALSSQSKSNKKLLSIVADVCNDEEDLYLTRLNDSNIEFAKELKLAKEKALNRLKSRNESYNKIQLNA